MSKKYKQIISELEEAVADIQSKGISIEPLNKAIEELKAHSDNISAIEENIDAVKSEVITPIKDELEQNKKAGKFSILGFYVGAFGLAVTAISLLYTTFKSPDSVKMISFSDTTNQRTKYTNPKDYLISIDNTLKELTYSINGLNDTYIVKSNELYLNRSNDERIILQNDSVLLTVKAYVPAEEKIESRYYPVVSLTFFLNGKQLGTKGLKEKVTIDNNSGISHYYDDWSSIWLTENDSFVIFKKFKFKIIRIFRTESQILTLADKEKGVLIKRIE